MRWIRCARRRSLRHRLPLRGPPAEVAGRDPRRSIGPRARRHWPRPAVTAGPARRRRLTGTARGAGRVLSRELAGVDDGDLDAVAAVVAAVLRRAPLGAVEIHFPLSLLLGSVENGGLGPKGPRSYAGQP